MKRQITTLVLTLSALGPQAQASGFALIEQSVSSMGTAYAGGAAQAEDATTIFFNPAGMTRLTGTLVSAGAQIIIPQAKFKDSGSTFAAALGGAPLGGGNGGDAGEAAAVPHAYLSHQLNEKTWFGFAINAPFGLATKYDDGWVGRYHALKSEVKTINLNPSLAYKVNDKVSLGVGLSAQYMEAELSNAIDFGSIDAATPLGLGLGGPGASDGKVVLEGDSWGWGFNLGTLIDLSEQTRLGLHYRSEIKQTLKGSADFSGAAQAAVAGVTGIFTDTAVKSSIKLPATASISLFHEINPEWSVMADYTWTNWSKVPELRFDFSNAQPDGVTTLNWKNSSRYSIGASYSPASSPWVFRGGLAFDETPIPDSSVRTPRVPGEDRTWVTIGAGYRSSDTLTFDFGYAHIFVDDAVISKAAAAGTEDFIRGALNGSYDSSVDIFSAQLEYRFN